MIRKLLSISIVTAILLIGCKSASDEPYPFRQDFDQIVSIEILKKEQATISIDTPMYVLKVLDPGEHQAIVDAILEMEGGRVVLDPSTDFGYYIIRITYKDGEMELIGNYNNAHVSTDGTIHVDSYAFDKDQFYDVISEFLGEEVTEFTYG